MRGQEEIFSPGNPPYLGDWGLVDDALSGTLV